VAAARGGKEARVGAALGGAYKGEGRCMGAVPSLGQRLAGARMRCRIGKKEQNT
jgi:hypothetical protein